MQIPFDLRTSCALGLGEASASLVIFPPSLSSTQDTGCLLSMSKILCFEVSIQRSPEISSRAPKPDQTSLHISPVGVGKSSHPSVAHLSPQRIGLCLQVMFHHNVTAIPSG